MSENTVGQQWMASINARKQASTLSSTGGVLTPQMVFEDLKKKSPEQIKAIQLALKNAGKRVQVTGKVTPKFFTEYWTTYNEAKGYVLGTGQQWNDQAFATYLVDSQMDVNPSGGAGGSGSTLSTSVSNPTAAKDLINKVVNDTLGRGATKDEVKKWTEYLNAKERKNPTKTTVSGSNVTVTGGLDREQLLVDQLAGTDEAKRNRALEAYTYLLQVMGGGR